MPGQVTSPAYAASVRQALASKRDLWGDQLLALPGGPTYDAARAYLAPILYAQKRQYKPLTPSGAYYLAFTYPPSVYSPPVYTLHVADGSEIITRRVGDGSLAIDVGPRGADHYGACTAWLTPATLADGYLPILQTGYVDRQRRAVPAGVVPGPGRNGVAAGRLRQGRGGRDGPARTAPSSPSVRSCTARSR